MSDQHTEIDAALQEIERARRLLGRIPSPQVRNAEHRDLLKATALSWFRSRRPVVALLVRSDLVEAIDAPYRIVLDAADRAATKTTYLAALKETKIALLQARAESLAPKAGAPSPELSPDFSTLAADPQMRAILQRRWEECRRCLSADASLAATVMMGGLLEALFVARANRLADKARLFKCAATPIDPKTRKPLDLRYWMLGPYIEVGHELGWITTSAKDVAGILRDYRNYVHPEKERSHGITLKTGDAQMFWEVTKSLSRQLVSMQGLS